MCGTDELQNLAVQAAAAAGTHAHAGPVQCPIEAKIAIETDWEFTEFFNGDIDASGAYVITLLAAVGEIYANDTGVGLVVSHLSLWTTANDPWTEDNAILLLFEFMEYWNQFQTDVSRHTAHFLTTRQLDGAAGVAFQPGLCQGDLAYGLSAYIEGSFPYPLEIDGHPQNWDLVVVAHELGHNFGASHTHQMEPPVDECAFGVCIVDPKTELIEGTIMSYCHLCEGGVANINLFFHERSLNEEILPYLAELPCGLSKGSITITSHPGSLSLCVGDAAIFSVTATSQQPLAYQWRKNAVNIAGATSPQLIIGAVTVANIGSYDVSIDTDCASVISDPAVLLVDDMCGPPGGSCPADLDGDNNVGITDFLALLLQWGFCTLPCPPTCPADFDGDCFVGITDFLELLANWGPC